MDTVFYERYAFLAEWFQEEARLTRSFLLYYFPIEDGIEIYDGKSHKTFLKRTRVHDLDERNFHIGAKINVFGRQFTLVDYADEVTRKKLAGRRERTFCLIKSDAIKKSGEIIKFFYDNGFVVTNCVMVELNMSECAEFLDLINISSSVNCDLLQPGAVIALELCASNAVKRLHEAIGSGTKNSLSNLFSHDFVKNGIYSSQSNETVQKEIQYFFPSPHENVVCSPKPTAIFNNTTLGIIKPHAIKEGKFGDILMEITSNGLVITAMKMFNLPRENCEEFHEVYKDVVPHYIQMVIELSNGPFIAMEIASGDSNGNAYSDFRHLCGPYDPEIARQIRPKSLRAKFGTNKVQNAVHCTDLEEDCYLEVEYFFKILSQ